MPLTRNLALIILTLWELTSCGYKQGDNQSKPPNWQDNFYKYRNTNAPKISHERFYRLNSSDKDTIITNLLEFPKTEIININSSSVKHIPNEIKSLVELKALNITWTDMTQFPRVIFELPNLVSLDIAFSDTTIVVDTLCGNFKMLKNLEMLSLISCNLTDLPLPLTDLRRLKYLNLGTNKIRNMTAPISKLDSLVEIDFSQNELTDFPKDINRLKNLEVLNLSDNNISDFPSEIIELPNVKEINLMHNPKFKLTVDIAKNLKHNWKNLETLYLIGTNHSENEIKKLNEILPGKLVFFWGCGTK